MAGAWSWRGARGVTTSHDPGGPGSDTSCPLCDCQSCFSAITRAHLASARGPADQTAQSQGPAAQPECPLLEGGCTPASRPPGRRSLPSTCLSRLWLSSTPCPRPSPGRHIWALVPRTPPPPQGLPPPSPWGSDCTPQCWHLQDDPTSKPQVSTAVTHSVLKTMAASVRYDSHAIQCTP